MKTPTTDARWNQLAELLRPIHGRALASARRLCRSSADGDDLYQESVLRAFDKLESLRDPSRFHSWFYAIMLSRHRNRYRRVFWKRVIPMDHAFTDGREPVGEDGTRWFEAAEGASRASEALAYLDPVQRECIVLFEIDGYAIEEIARMQEASISAVKSRLARGRRKLRRYYERRGWSSSAPTERRQEAASRAEATRESAASRAAAARWVAIPAFVRAGEERSRD